MTELKSGRGGPRGPELALVGKSSGLRNRTLEA